MSSAAAERKMAPTLAGVAIRWEHAEGMILAVDSATKRFISTRFPQALAGIGAGWVKVHRFRGVQHTYASRGLGRHVGTVVSRYRRTTSLMKRASMTATGQLITSEHRAAGQARRHRRRDQAAIGVRAEVLDAGDPVHAVVGWTPTRTPRRQACARQDRLARRESSHRRTLPSAWSRKRAGSEEFPGARDSRSKRRRRRGKGRVIRLRAVPV